MANIYKTPDEIRELLEAEEIDSLEQYTSLIQYSPKMVLQFEEAYTSFFEGGGDISWDDDNEGSLLSILNESIDEFRTFRHTMKSHWDTGTYLTFLFHGGSNVTVEFGWKDVRFGKVLWDRWQGAVRNPVLAFADIAYQFDAFDYQCVAKSRPLPEPAMYQYHPERYKAYRDYVAKLPEIYHQEANKQTGMIYSHTLQKIGNLFVEDYNRQIQKYPRRFHPDNGHFIMETEPLLAMAYGRFAKAGRQIMHFPPELLGMLRQTDVENIPMNAINLPFLGQYIYLGPQPELELAPGWFVDGAYVESRGEPGDLKFTVTAAPADRAWSALWYVHHEPCYVQDFIETYRGTDLAHAIDGVLSEKKQAISKKMLEVGGDITEQVLAEAKKEGQTLAIPEGLKLVDISSRNALIRLEMEKRQHPVYRAAMRLIVNALCYLTAYPDDITRVWPEGTPRSLREKTESEDSKTATKAFSKLSSMGYSPIHICGKRVIEQRDAAGISTSHHGVSQHWRRGHWRNQVHGVGLSLRKLIWIMPVLVGTAGENEVPGHIYLVS